jgi:hypothetical protein
VSHFTFLDDSLSDAGEADPDCAVTAFLARRAEENEGGPGRYCAPDLPDGRQRRILSRTASVLVNFRDNIGLDMRHVHPVCGGMSGIAAILLLLMACPLPRELRRSLACTNMIENVMGTVRRVRRNVKRCARRQWRYVGPQPPCRKRPRASDDSRLTSNGPSRIDFAKSCACGFTDRRIADRNKAAHTCLLRPNNSAVADMSSHA